jgi:hypothetical protein
MMIRRKSKLINPCVWIIPAAIGTVGLAFLLWKLAPFISDRILIRLY